MQPETSDQSGGPWDRDIIPTNNLPDRDLRIAANKNATPEPAQQLDVSTEHRLAERLAENHAFDLRYDHHHVRWVIFDTHLWRPDRDGRIYRLTIALIRRLQIEALAMPSGPAREHAIKMTLRAESKTGLDHILSHAQHVKPLSDSGEWDADPWLLGAPNGVIDLRKGELRTGVPEDRVTQAVTQPYDPDAACPRWHQFLDEVFDGHQDLIAWVQRFVGYSITGSTREQILALLYGLGANGKTVFLNALKYMLGDYAWNMPFSTIEIKQRAAIPADLAAIAGRRFVTSSETNSGVRLNESRIKALTGSDTITARHLYGRDFQFRPMATFWLSTNHKPVVRDDSHGFWRRIRLIPFTQTFEGSARDEQLEEQLVAEAPGILRWAVEGCLLWQQTGLEAPAVVTAATADYERDSDVLRDFLDEACELDPESRVAARELFTAYTKWTETQRVHKMDCLSAKQFGQRMGERFEKGKAATGWYYKGLRIESTRLW